MSLTERTIAAIQTLRSEGHFYKEIAEIMRVSYKAVVKYAKDVKVVHARKDLGLPPRKNGCERSFDADKAYNLHKKYSLTYEELAERFGVPYERMARAMWRQKHREKRDRRRYEQEEFARLNGNGPRCRSRRTQSSHARHTDAARRLGERRQCTLESV